MKMQIRTFCFLAGTFLSFSAFAADPAPTTTTAPTTATDQAAIKLPQTLNLNGITWTLAFKQENTDIKMGEYVLPGENVDNWTQLITYQLFKFDFPNEITPLAFADREVDEMKKKGYDIIYDKIQSSPNEAIIEFRVKAPTAEQQDEIQRLIRTADNHFVLLHYVIKKFDMGATERAKWINIIKTIDPATFS